MRHTSLYKTKYDMNGPWILLDKILTRIWLFKSDLYVVASSSKAESQSPIIPMKIHRVPGWAAESSVGAWPDPTFDDSRRRVNVRVRVMNLCLSIIYWHPKRILWTSLGPLGIWWAISKIWSSAHPQDHIAGRFSGSKKPITVAALVSEHTNPLHTCV